MISVALSPSVPGTGIKGHATTHSTGHSNSGPVLESHLPCPKNKHYKLFITISEYRPRMNFGPTDMKPLSELPIFQMPFRYFSFHCCEFPSLLQTAIVFLVYVLCSFTALTIHVKDGSYSSKLSVYQLLLS